MKRWTLLTLVLMFSICVLSVSCGDDDDDDNSDDKDTSSDTWTDSSSGLMWMNSDYISSLEEAIEYCENLSLGSYNDWHLPTISVLRSLIRGCGPNESGGSCSVEDDCLSFEDCGNGCTSCEPEEGPGLEGKYWPYGLIGASPFCGSSSVAQHSIFGPGLWQVDFYYGAVVYTSIQSGLFRCVRSLDEAQ